MRFDDWLDAERGRLTKVAAHFEVSPSAVSQWRVNGVPVDSMLALYEFTGKEVSLEEMLERSAHRSDQVPQQAAGQPRREQMR